MTTASPTDARTADAPEARARHRGEPRDACRMCGHVELDELGPVKGYAFRCCRRCRFTFTPLDENRATRVGDQEFYHNAPEEGWAHGLWFLQPALERLADGPLEILDFGAGESKIPGLLRKKGHRTLAVDLRPPLEPHPDRLTGDVLELPLESGRFDLVYSFQVFEHLEQPVPILRRLIELTRSGGLILIHTDMEMPERDAEGFDNWWYVMPPQHCSYYRHRTFEVFFDGRPEAVIWKDAKRVLILV